MKKSLSVILVCIGFSMGSIFYAPNKTVLYTFGVVLVVDIICFIVKLNKKVTK